MGCVGVAKPKIKGGSGSVWGGSREVPRVIWGARGGKQGDLEDTGGQPGAGSGTARGAAATSGELVG